MHEPEQTLLAWSARVASAACLSRTRREELTDHLFCEYQRLLDEGLAPADAAEAAIENMGSVEALVREYAKDRSLLGRLFIHFEARHAAAATSHMTPLQIAALTIGVSLFWAGAMLLTGRLVGEAIKDDVVSVLLIGWVATWMLPVALLDLGSARCEWRWFRRRALGLFGRA